MGLLSREGMRDGDIGICWDAGHIGICGICGDMWDMRRYVGYVGYAGRTTSPKSARPCCRFLVHPPPTCINHKTGTANYQPDEKRMFIFRLTC